MRTAREGRGKKKKKSQFWSAYITFPQNQTAKVLDLLCEQQQGMCKCSGKIKMTENAILSSGSEGVSNTPVII